MIDNDNAILTVKTTNQTMFQDGVNKLISKGYHINSTGYTGGEWWAIMYSAEVVAKVREGK